MNSSGSSGSSRSSGSAGSAGSPGAPASTEQGRAATQRLEVAHRHTREPLRVCVRESVESYLHHLDGHGVSNLFDLVIAEVEAPLLESVLAHTRGNQSRAAAMLGINRATLRKKLKRYDLI